MGCVFSRNEALSFRKRRKTPKIHHGRERLTTSLYGVHPVKKPVQNNVIPPKPIENHPTQSKGVTNIKHIYENIHQEYSLLGFLTGGKNFPDEELVFNKPTATLKAIPEALPQPNDTTNTVPAACMSQEAIHEVPETITASVKLPDCLTYEGLHEYGFHLFIIDSEKYCASVESSDYIPEAISCLIGRDRFVVVYKQSLGYTAYLPDQSAYARDLFHTLCTRLGEQLLRIVFYNPSWYVQVCLDVQNRKRQHFFSVAAMEKLKFIQHSAELAKLTGNYYCTEFLPLMTSLIKLGNLAQVAQLELRTKTPTVVT